MNQASHLYRLQQIDTQLAQVNAQIDEIDRFLAGDEAINHARAAVDEKHQAVQKAQQALKQSEFAVKDHNLKIEQTEATLYGGKVRSPKELQDLQKEIASLKKHLSHLEDLQLESMVAAEEADQAYQDAKKALAQLEAAFIEKSAVWRGQREQLLRSRERFLAERAPALVPITKENLVIYDRLRQRKSGVAVTLVKEGSCSMCGATVRPGEAQAVRASHDLFYCSDCGRILYTG